MEITKDGTLTWTRIFTGVVDDTAGVVGEREIRVGITDGVGSLDKAVSVPPRNFRHPSPRVLAGRMPGRQPENNEV